MMDWKQLKAVPESGCILYLPVKYPSERKKELVALLDHSHIKALRGQEVPIWKRITQAKAEGTRALMVPYVAQRLFPEKEAEDVCLYWELYSGLFDDFCHAEWYIVFSEGKKLNFYFREVHLTLFPSGIGFLEIHIGLKEATLADWVDALSVLRGPYEKAFISLRQDSLRRESVFYLLQLQDRLSSLADIFNHLLPVKPNSDEEGTLYIPNHFVPYAYIITQDAPAQGEEEEINSLKEVLYRLRNFFPTSYSVFPPQKGDLSLNRTNLFQYATRAWFVASLEGTSFLAINPKPEFKAQLLNSLRTIYPTIFRVVLSQHFYLIYLSQNVLRSWIDASTYRRKVRIFRKMTREYLSFLSSELLPQIFQRERHHKTYLFWQKVMEVPHLYARTHKILREVYEYIEEENLRHLQRLLNALGILIGLPSLALAALSINIIGFTTQREGVSWTIVVWVLVSSFLAGLFLMVSWSVIPSYIEKVRRLYNPIRFKSRFIGRAA